FAVQALRVRFGPQDVGVFLLDHLANDPVVVKVGLKLPMIMAPLDRAIPEALAVVIPLVDLSGKGPPQFSWSFSFAIDSDWDTNNQPIVTFQNHWIFSSDFLGLDIPVEFLDRSQSMSLGGLHFNIAEMVGDVL